MNQRDKLNRLFLTLFDAAEVIDQELASAVHEDIVGDSGAIVPSHHSADVIRRAVSRLREILQRNRFGRHTKGVLLRCPNCPSREDQRCFCDRSD